ncbi:hypothetical protein AAD018_012310 [Aestuariibius insulae]|uniref:hypothetical protein n=1 Tax=Aestuariibius insulae TaxID=2058287 RepID=UPI00345E9113
MHPPFWVVDPRVDHRSDPASRGRSIVKRTSPEVLAITSFEPSGHFPPHSLLGGPIPVHRAQPEKDPTADPRFEPVEPGGVLKWMRDRFDRRSRDAVRV